MSAKTEAVGYQPNVTRRFYVAGAVFFSLALGAYALAGLPFELPIRDAPLGIVLTLIIAAQHYWRINSRDTFRRSHESLDGLPITFGVFFVSPAWFVIMSVAGPYIAWSFGTDHTPRVRWLNTSGSALMAVSGAIIFAELSPTGPLDSPQALLAVLGMWVANEIVRLAIVITYTRARYDTWTGPHLAGRLRSMANRTVPVMFGYLAAVAAAGDYWMLPAVMFAIVLMYYLLYYSTLSASLESIVSWFLSFFGRIDVATEAETIEDALRDSFQQFAVLTSYGVAVVGDDDQVLWKGDVSSEIRDGVNSRAVLEALSETIPVDNPFWTGTLWAWPVDRARHSYMVATGLMDARGIADVTQTGGYLVESSRLAIDTMRRRRRFEIAAATESRRARTDLLTGLPNRLGFIEQLAAMLRSRSGDRVAVLQASLVEFQHTVDVLGTEIGDELLMKFAKRLERIADATATIQAIGRGVDDSFLVAVVGDEDIDRLAALISEPAEGADGTLMSRDVWIGAAEVDEARSITADELVQRAHLAMDRSEAEDRPMTFGLDDVVRERRRVSIRLRLPRAIETGAIQPAFQPQVELGTQRLVGCEVLARWADSQIGAVTPLEFVEISEQSQQIELLTLSLLRQALELDLTDASGRRIPLSLNLSARSMGNDSFVESLASLIVDRGRSLEDFTFEVAESTVASDGLATIFGIEHLRTLGARVSIDDFGTGNSTLSYLDKLPVHEIKIDRSLTSTIGTTEDPNPVIRHVIGLCGDLGLAVVAEGIENAQQRDLARELGCDRAQGYLFARPMGPAETADWVRAQSTGDHQSCSIAR